MSETRRQGGLLICLSLALAAFLAGQALFVWVDYEACFENNTAVSSGERLLRVAEMSLAQLAYVASKTIGADQVLFATLGLLPLCPFWIAWKLSDDRGTQKLWVMTAIVAFVAIVAWNVTIPLSELYDCDRKGVSLGLVLMPFTYTVGTLAAAVVLAVARSLYLSLSGMDGE